VLYMHRFIKAFRKAELDHRFGAVLVIYADDFVVLCQHHAQQALAIIRRWFTVRGLELNAQKTTVKHARKESFDFLVYTFTMLHSYKTGTGYPGVIPSKKALRRVKDKVRKCLKRTNLQPLPEVVATVNHKLRGWAHYFRYGSVARTRQTLDDFVYQRMRGFLRRRDQVRTRGAGHFSRPSGC